MAPLQMERRMVILYIYINEMSNPECEKREVKDAESSGSRGAYG
jgi:hypothetical protein